MCSTTRFGPLIQTARVENDAWDMLTRRERRILKGKLKREEIRPGEGETRWETGREAFNRMANQAAGGDQDRAREFVAGVKNLIDGAGGRANSAIWREIKTIDGGWMGNSDDVSLALTVNKSETFLETAAANGYQVDPWYEAYNATGKHAHSVRQVTGSFLDTSLHFVQEQAYLIESPDRFDAHWDYMSCSFKPDHNGGARSFGLPSIHKIAISGIMHSRRVPASQTRRELKQKGIIPRNEV